MKMKLGFICRYFLCDGVVNFSCTKLTTFIYYVSFLFYKLQEYRYLSRSHGPAFHTLNTESIENSNKFVFLVDHQFRRLNRRNRVNFVFCECSWDFFSSSYFIHAPFHANSSQYFFFFSFRRNHNLQSRILDIRDNWHFNFVIFCSARAEYTKHNAY